MSQKLIELAEATSVASTDLVYVVDDPAGTPGDKKVAIGNLVNAVVYHVKGVVANPNGYYSAIRTVVPLFRASANLTITRIHIHGPDSTPTTELDIDLKYADDVFDGSFANSVVIDVCDTTSGLVTKTSGFDDATVPAAKYVYWSFGAQPHTDWLDFWFEVHYTFD